MAVHDYVIDDQTTPVFRADLNNALSAIVTNNSNATAPSTTYAGMFWFDTSANQLKMRDGSNANWIIVGELDTGNSRWKLISDSLKAASSGGIDIFNSAGSKIIDLEVASQATAEAGTNNTELMTPLRVSQAITAAAPATPVLTGIVFPYAGTAAPTGYLLCYGQNVSTTTYSALFAVVGYTYGGSGASFGIPDLRGRVIAGQDDMGGTSANRLTSPLNGDTLAATGGSESHTLTTAQLPSHTHSIVTSWPLGGDPEEDTGNTGYYVNTTNDANGAATYTTTNYNGSNIIGATGSGSAHNNVQPTIILNYIIKT